MMAGEDVTDYLYPLDITGAALTNKVENEFHTINPPEQVEGEVKYNWFIPFAAPYYRNSLKMIHVPTGRELIRGTDWMPGHKFIDASFETEGKYGGIYASVLLMDLTLSGQIKVSEYQTLGGTWTLNENKIFELMANRVVDPRTVSYETVSGKPEVFPPLPHAHDITDVTGAAELIAATYDIAAALRERTQDWLDNPPHLPGDMTPELIEQYNVRIQQQLLDYYTKTQTNTKIDTLDTTLRQLIADIQNGNQSALDDYLTKLDAAAQYATKAAIANLISQSQLQAYTYSHDEIDNLFSALNLNMASLVDAAVNVGLNTTTVNYVSFVNIVLRDFTPVDGKVPAFRDTILVAGQTVAADNGLYVVDAGAWKRTSWVISEGLTVKVKSGGVSYGNTKWDLLTIGTIVPGTTPLTFKRVGNMRLRDLFISSVAPDPSLGVDGDIYFQT